MLVPAVLVAGGACAPIPTPEGKSPLGRAQMSRDSCVLDIFFVRFPLADDDANGPLWNEIDEQRLPGELRRQLAQNGFRVGLVGGQMPIRLAQMLELTDKTIITGQCQEVRLSEMESAPPVVRHHLQLPPGRRRQIVASGVYDKLSVLWPTPDGVCGESFAEAQGVLAVEAFPEADGRVRLEFVPEVHYGQFAPRIAGHQQAFRIKASRSQRAFDDMAFSLALTPGDMLVVSSFPDRPGSLGHRFFTHLCEGRQEQKLLVIRLSQTQHDDLFSPPDVPPANHDNDRSLAFSDGLTPRAPSSPARSSPR
jgi:hypothetical protein